MHEYDGPQKGWYILEVVILFGMMLSFIVIIGIAYLMKG